MSRTVIKNKLYAFSMHSSTEYSNDSSIAYGASTGLPSLPLYTENKKFIINSERDLIA